MAIAIDFLCRGVLVNVKDIRGSFFIKWMPRCLGEKELKIGSTDAADGYEMRISKSGIIASLVTIVIGTFCIYASWEGYSEYRRISEYGGYATGYVTKKHCSRASNGKSTYYIDYWFSPALGEKVNAIGIISKQQWESLEMGDSLEVRYSLPHPDHNVPKYGGSVSLAYVFFFFLLGAVFLVYGIMRIMQMFRLNRS